MNKRVILVVAAVALLIGAFFAWNQFMLNQLDKELNDAKASVENYKPEGEQGKAKEELDSLKVQYPEFFKGAGFSSADFSARTDLEDKARKFKETVEEERKDIREHLSSTYAVVVGARPQMNEIVEKTDEKFVMDIMDFALFNPERIKLYEKSVDYCAALKAGDKKFFDSQDLPAEEKLHLAVVLDNAQHNLCPKL